MLMDTRYKVKGVFALLKTASGRKDEEHFKIRVLRLLIQAVSTVYYFIRQRLGYVQSFCF